MIVAGIISFVSCQKEIGVLNPKTLNASNGIDSVAKDSTHPEVPPVKDSSGNPPSKDTTVTPRPDTIPVIPPAVTPQPDDTPPVVPPTVKDTGNRKMPTLRVAH